MMAPEVKDQLDRTQEVELALEHHPARQWENPNALLKRQKRLQKLYADLV